MFYAFSDLLYFISLRLVVSQILRYEKSGIISLIIEGNTRLVLFMDRLDAI